MSTLPHRIRSLPAAVLSMTLLMAASHGSVSAQTFRSATDASVAFPAPLVGANEALAVGDEEIFIGEGDLALRGGRVHVHARASDGTWAETQVLQANDPMPGDGFGSAIAIDGTTLLVSAAGGEHRPAVLTFERRGGEGWVPAGRLDSGDADGSGGFGSVIALQGEWAFVSAPEEDEARGTVTIFERGPDGWLRRGVLPAEPAEGDRFGEAMAIADGRLFVGSPGRDDETGGVTVFRLDESSNAWLSDGALPMYGVGEGSELGGQLAAAEGRVVVAAPGFGPLGPTVFVYDRNDGDAGWVPSSRLVAFDGFPTDAFGRGLAVIDGEIWVGAPDAATATGATYRFVPGENGWSASTRLSGDAFSAADRFGGAVVGAGDIAAVRALGEPRSGSTVTIFERGEAGTWEAAGTIRSEGEALTALTGESRECGAGGQVAQFGCENVELLSFLPISDLGGGDRVRLNDVWGWEDEEEGREYALVGRSDGLSFVDITDPTNPVVVGEMLRTQGSPNATWRDMKVYQDHAFVVADASRAHGMQVFDLTRLRQFQGEPITFEPDVTYTGIHSAHNVAVNEESGYAFVVGANGGGQTCGGGLHMVDIGDPTDPAFAGCFADPQTGRASTGYTHDAQCVLYRGPDERHRDSEICFGANETALSVANVTDKEAPVAISRAAYPNVGYSHQVWITEDHRYVFMNDELDVLSGLVDRTRTVVWDVTELDDPQVAHEYFSPVSASAHNLYIVGDLMYQSNYASGLRIVDVSDPEQPVEVGHLDTAPFDPSEPGFVGSWSNYPFFRSGTVAVTSVHEGLFLVRYRSFPPVS